MLNTLIIFSAQYLIFIIAIIATVFVFNLEALKRKSIIKLLVISSVVGLVMDKILNYFISSPRPFVVNGTVPSFAHLANNGFPSEHTLAAILIAAVIFVYNRKLGILLGVLGTVIGISRVLAKVHNPIDILGGFVVAVFAVFLGNYFISKKISKLATTELL